MIPEDIARFIEERIDSVAALEAILILRQDPETKWDVRSLSDRLYIKHQDAEHILRTLVQHELAAPDGGDPARYSYAPRTSEHREILDRLAGIYSRHIVPIANLIHRKPRHRVQGFADAFKLKKDD